MSSARRLSVMAFGLVACLASSGAALAGVCPAVGRDTDCGIIITVTDIGATVSFTGQGPYDGIEDTLVGIINQSSRALRSIGLRSTKSIFGFDQDGICGTDPNTGLPYNPAPGGCPFGPTGYEGPGVSFSNIDPTLQNGVVNFATAVPPNGGQGYFSLEESIQSAYACKDVVNHSVVPSTSGSPTIMATFTPQVSGMSTADAAKFCGVAKLNWIQKVTSIPDPSPFYAVNPQSPNDLASDIHLTSSSTPFNDPYQGGYRYNPAWNSYPFYFDPNTTTQPWSLRNWDNGTILKFQDTPTNPCLQGSNSTGVRGCLGANAPAGSKVLFSTNLAGVLADGSPVDLGVGFTWSSNFNGTSGGVVSTANLLPADPGSGTGGITVTGIQDTTNYNYNGIVVTTVNGVTVTGPLDTVPPVVTVSATPANLWPPNGRNVSVVVAGKITDNEVSGTGVNPQTAAYKVADSYGQVQPAGPIVLNSDGSYSFNILLPAYRYATSKDGRNFTITVYAQDTAGNTGSSSFKVVVPHDQRK